jgi:hypothetical protein
VGEQIAPTITAGTIAATTRSQTGTPERFGGAGGPAVESGWAVATAGSASAATGDVSGAAATCEELSVDDNSVGVGSAAGSDGPERGAQAEVAGSDGFGASGFWGS